MMLDKQHSSLIIKIIAGLVGLAFVASLVIGILPEILSSNSGGQSQNTNSAELASYAKRVEELEKVLKENPNQPNVLYEQGAVFYQWGSALEQAKKTQEAVGKYEKASQVLKKSYDLEPKPDLMALLGNVFFDRARAFKTLSKQTEANTGYQEAIDHYQKYLEANPNNADVRTDMGIAYFEKGDSQTAISNFNQVIETNPQHAKAWFNLGFVTDRSGNTQEAVKAWKQYLKIESSGPNADYVKSRLNELEAKK